MRNQPHPPDRASFSPSEPGLVAIAHIGKTRGRRGEVVARALTDYPDRFADVHEAYIQLPAGELRAVQLDNYWFHQHRLILRFAGYDTIDRAQELVGGIVKIEENELLTLPEDEFFYFQLIDCRVQTTDGAAVGRVINIMETAGSPLLIIRGADDKQHLIPFVKSICPKVDVELKRIDIDPPEGLLDL